MKKILTLFFIVYLSDNCVAQTINETESKKKDTFSYSDNIKIVLLRAWETSPYNTRQPPEYDTAKLINIIRLFLDSAIKKQIPEFYENTKIIIIASTIRQPWNMDLGYVLSFTVTGNDGTDFENLRLYRSYSCDIALKKMYSSIWFNEDIVKRWLDKWHITLKKKLVKNRLYR